MKRTAAALCAAFCLLSPPCAAESWDEIAEGLDDLKTFIDTAFEKERGQAAGGTDWVYLDEAAPASLATVPQRLDAQDTAAVYYAMNTGPILLSEEACDALLAMNGAAEKDGVELFLRRGYQSLAAERERMARREASGLKTEDPEFSDWRTGLAVVLVGRDWRTKELTADFGETAEAAWLEQHCAEFGFIIRYPRGCEKETGHDWEPWHLRYVGTEVTMRMLELGTRTMEAYQRAAQAHEE